jgi:bifunctional ADP-heptose synthase (sugar kinase/adenylyltransferase)
VDAVVLFEEDTPVRALRRLRPHVWAKGGDYVAEQLPERTALDGWGGRVVTLPYVEGRSTTGLLKEVAFRVAR